MMTKDFEEILSSPASSGHVVPIVPWSIILEVEILVGVIHRLFPTG